MAEIMLTAYGIGYLQVYGLHNFDEAEELGKREGFSMFFCTGLYTAASFGFGWFGRTLRKSKQSQHTPDRGRLPCAVRPEKSEDIPFLYRK